MRKITLFIASLFMTFAAVAQTPKLLLEYNNVNLTNGPVELSSEDAAKIISQSAITFIVEAKATNVTDSEIVFGAVKNYNGTLNANNDILALGVGSSTTRIYISNQTGGYYSRGRVSTGNVCLAYTLSSSESEKLYVDRVQQEPNKDFNSSVLFSAFTGENAKFYIGGVKNSSTTFGQFSGTIYSVKIYEGALTAAKMNDLFNTEKAEALAIVKGVEGKIGYPTNGVIEDYKSAVDEATNLGGIEAAKQDLYGSTDVNLPEPGKMYTIKMVNKYGNKFYFQYNGTRYDMVAWNEGDEIPATSAYTCEAGGAEGTVSLRTHDDKYLVYHSKNDGVGWLENSGNTTGIQEAKGPAGSTTGSMTDITFSKIVKGGNVEPENEALFGLLKWYSLRGYDTGKKTDCYGYMVLISSGSDFDGADATFLNAGYSSALLLEEFAAPEPDIATSYTLTQVTASELNELTEATTIAIKNVSKDNSYWLAGLSDVETFGDNVLLTWEPAVDGAAGQYNIRTSEGYFKNITTNDQQYTLTENKTEAAVFEAFNPTLSAGTSDSKLYFNGDSKDKASYVNILSADDPQLVRFVTIQGTGYGNWINCAGTSGDTKYHNGNGGFTIHHVYVVNEVEEFIVNITDAKYATFCAPANVVLPDNATAYIIDGTLKSANVVELKEVTGILPANTGVILFSETPVECKLAATSDEATADVTGNKLVGTFFSKYVENTENLYGLAKGQFGVGLYNITDAEGCGGFSKFQSPANKAYVDMAGVAASSVGFRFDFGGTTAIEEVETENGVEAVYDLQGRRINEITQPGIYVVGGVKRVVK